MSGKSAAKAASPKLLGPLATTADRFPRLSVAARGQGDGETDEEAAAEEAGTANDATAIVGGAAVKPEGLSTSSSKVSSSS